MSGHFKSEEDVLLPYLWENEVTTQFLAEHKQIKELVITILDGKDCTKEDVLKLSDLINNHIRFEERTMFPWIENEALTDEELATVGEKLKDTEVAAHHFTPKFWKNEN